MSKDLSIFVPIRKIDEEQRLVYGTVAAEVVDNSGEVFDYEGSKPYFQKWSDNAWATSGGKSRGNLRVMHTSKVAGVLTDLGFNDDDRVIECCAKVVSDDEWNMVQAGAYTGFSMGGRYVSRAEKSDGRKFYIADPVEVSLVDKPCIPTATFEVIKADGIVEEREFHPELAKADGPYADPGYQDDEKPRYPIDTEQHIRAAWSYINKPKNAGEYTADQVKKIKAKIVAAWKKTIDKDGPPSAEKADNGDEQMYVPTNDEVLPVARALAKAAGKTDDDWLEFNEQAREQLVAEHAAKADAAHDPENCDKSDCPDCAASKADKPFPPKKDGEDDEDAKGDKSDDDDAKAKKDDKAAKADAPDGDEAAPAADAGAEGDEPEADAAKSDEPELEQVWKAKDGTTFAKKADAVAHNDALAKADAEAGTGSLADQLRKATEAAKSIGTDDDEEDDEKDEQKSEKAVLIASIADPLAKFRAFEGDKLVKGMYGVERLSCILASLDDLHCMVSCEAAYEGDNSTLPAELVTAMKSLGQTLVNMATEEVNEMVAMAEQMDKPKGEEGGDVMALAATTLGLEKSAFEQNVKDRLEKRAPAKQGDTLAKLDDETVAKLAKVDTLEQENAALKADMAEMTPLVKGLVDEIERIKKMPMPKAPTTRAVSKGDDGNGGLQKGDTPSGPSDLLKHYSPDQLADAAIRLSHQHGRHFVAPPGGGGQ